MTVEEFDRLFAEGKKAQANGTDLAQQNTGKMTMAQQEIERINASKQNNFTQKDYSNLTQKQKHNMSADDFISYIANKKKERPANDNSIFGTMKRNKLDSEDDISFFLNDTNLRKEHKSSNETAGGYVKFLQELHPEHYEKYYKLKETDNTDGSNVGQYIRQLLGKEFSLSNVIVCIVSVAELFA